MKRVALIMATSNKNIISNSLAKKMLFCIDEYDVIKNKTSSKCIKPAYKGQSRPFWENFLEGSLYEDIDDLKNELLCFLVYYNDHRSLFSLQELTPKEFREKEKKCKLIT